MGAFVDITGQKFNEWVVLQYIGKGYWDCACSCGVRKNVMGKTLKSGASKSCGHSTTPEVEIGMQFNDLTAVEYVGDNKWKCVCSCGNNSVVKGIFLKTGHTKSCGHTRKEKLVQRNSEGRIHLEGKQFSDWKVGKYLGDKHYECVCSCGKIKNVAARDLTQGISKSCGHNNWKNNNIDIVGNVYGDLTVVKYLGNKRYECLCSCGNTTEVDTGNLKNGTFKSCGCKQYDRLEKVEIVNAIKAHIAKNGEYPFIQDLSDAFGRHPGNINRYINNYNLRQYINAAYGCRAERDLHAMFSGGIIQDRQALKGKELDIYYPDKKLAIEFNGSYWHSSKYKDKYYHQKKTLECARMGIQLIHIFEYEWQDKVKKEKLIALINKRFNSVERVYARNTVIKEVETASVKEFIEKYHIQGYATSKVNVGCYYNDELIGIMTFGPPRFNQNFQYELIRLAWREDVAVVGGTEKIFKYFTTNYKPDSMVTYCDIAKFTGNVYTRLGFKAGMGDVTEPNYVWTSGDGSTVLKRYQTMKHKLVESGMGTEEQTEDEIMINKGFYKVYDSGNLRLTWKSE